MNAIVSLACASAMCLLLLDIGCFLWLRHNEAGRLARAT